MNWQTIRQRLDRLEAARQHPQTRVTTSLVDRLDMKPLATRYCEIAEQGGPLAPGSEWEQSHERWQRVIEHPDGIELLANMADVIGKLSEAESKGDAQ